MGTERFRSNRIKPGLSNGGDQMPASRIIFRAAARSRGSRIDSRAQIMCGKLAAGAADISTISQVETRHCAGLPNSSPAARRRRGMHNSSDREFKLAEMPTEHCARCLQDWKLFEWRGGTSPGLVKKHRDVETLCESADDSIAVPPPPRRGQ